MNRLNNQKSLQANNNQDGILKVQAFTSDSYGILSMSLKK